MAFGLTFKSKDDVALHPGGLEEVVRKSKRDILGLKIMLYTAVILLVGGSLYYNNELQSAQKLSFLTPMPIPPKIPPTLPLKNSIRCFESSGFHLTIKG